MLSKLLSDYYWLLLDKYIYFNYQNNNKCKLNFDLFLK